jgi:hypothetical protein
MGIDNFKQNFMNTKYIIEELKRNKIIFKELLDGLPGEFYLWRFNPDKWCLLEIVCHLIDEEREDFRQRVRNILVNPELPLNSIDPVGWVKSRKYIERDYNTELKEFLHERDNSIKWLEHLENPKWDNFYKHPKLGDLSAKMIFANWLAHDYLHIRQILKLKYEYLKYISGEDLSYAGEW